MMNSTTLSAVDWHRSSYSNHQGACVEVAFAAGGVWVRDSKDPAGPVVCVGTREWSAFLRRLCE